MRRQGIGGIVSLNVEIPMNYDRRNDDETVIQELESLRRESQ